MERKEITPWAVAGILVIALAMLILAPGSVRFDGVRMLDEDQYQLGFNLMNSTGTADLTLGEGDAFKVNIGCEKGSLMVRIVDEAGTEIFRATEKTAVPETQINAKPGTYTITVEGKRAKGHVFVFCVRN